MLFFSHQVYLPFTVLPKSNPAALDSSPPLPSGALGEFVCGRVADLEARATTAGGGGAGPEEERRRRRRMAEAALLRLKGAAAGEGAAAKDSTMVSCCCQVSCRKNYHQ